MLDAFDAIGKLIQSPPGQLVAGATLGGVVWKFFEKLEAVVSDDTKAMERGGQSLDGDFQWRKTYLPTHISR